MEIQLNLKSIFLLVASVILMGLGVSLIVRADLGTTAFTAVPLVVSQLSSYTFGEMAIIFNVLLVIVQIVLLGKKFPFIQYFQLIVSIGLGWSIDFWGGIVRNLPLSHYGSQLLTIFVACLIIAVSITVQLEADLVNNPGEGIVRAISLRMNREFDRIKVPFDLSLVIIALTLSLLTLGEIVGVREGTLISAVLVGYYMRLIQNRRLIKKKVKEGVL